ncbi:MAG TPA: protein tyrosine phosphatase family protein [Blastocatellia bacterium]|nr:protein tyrosine phosphatase family protein [Blastocatellia bacterium]
MRNLRLQFIALGLLAALCVAGVAQEKTKLEKMQDELKDDVPHLLCVDENFATAGQPKDAAFSKLATNGYRAVLNLRTASEGVDLKHEQEAVEKAGMRYVNIPVVSNSPKPEQAEEFIKAVKNKDNQPMLIHCGSANRVGAFLMIYRVVELGWPEEKALEESTRVGLTSPVLKKFAQDYIATHKPAKPFSDYRSVNH